MTQNGAVAQDKPNKKPTFAPYIPAKFVLRRTCQIYGNTWLINQKEVVLAGYTFADPVWAKIERNRLRKLILTRKGLSDAEATILALHCSYTQILTNDEGGLIYMPSWVSLDLSANIAGKANRTMQRARTGLSRTPDTDKGQRNRPELMVAVGLTEHGKADGGYQKRMYHYAIDFRAIEKMPETKTNFVLSHRMAEKTQNSVRFNPFSKMSKGAEKVFTAILRTPEITNAALAKKCKISKPTVKRVKAQLIEAGAIKKMPTSRQGRGVPAAYGAIVTFLDQQHIGDDIVVDSADFFDPIED